VHRATERDLGALERLAAEAMAPKGVLWSARRERINPSALLAARAPLVVVSDGAGPVAFAGAVSDGVPLGASKCAEAIVYVSAGHRRLGAGRAAMAELLAVGRATGLWKMVAFVLSEDVAARTMLDRVDFREVGVLVKHVQIEGGWRDVSIYERLVLAARRSAPSINK
jgi:L-amino acid N-acyltransferase YncA